MNRFVRWPVFPFIVYGVSMLSFFSFIRAGLVIWQMDRIQTLETAGTVFLYGLRFDIIVICYLWLIPTLLLVFLPVAPKIKAIIEKISLIWYSVSVFVFTFLELTTPAFMDQYDTRPNRLFFEYLDTPKEVIRTSVSEYPIQSILTTLLLMVLVWGLVRLNKKIFFKLSPWSLWIRLLVSPLVLVFFFLGGRSSFDHRPANASTAAFTNDQMINKLGLNSTYTVLAAWNNLKHENSDFGAYGHLSVETMVKEVRSNSFLSPESFVSDPTSTWHFQKTTVQENKRNLVIILEESLGAGFVGNLGGIGVTPELDKLSAEGLWFTKLYATGTRSARGIEAVITGFPPSPSRSVLKLGLAQQRFSTLASILKTNQYDTQFIYGGESHFDNMAGFFLANGFDKVTDQGDYPNAKFRGTWGVCDEDLLDRLDEELNTATDNPKFILAFSSSNHSPFEFPDGTITLYGEEKNTVNNAVKYADYALGRFFKKAKTRSYWEDTLFLVVSDHDTRVFGAALVPLNKFHIPGVIIGKGVPKIHYEKVASQIDLAPTLLALLGISSQHPMIGHDLLSLPPEFPGRAIMQYGNNHAYRLGDQVVIHLPDKDSKQFQYTHNELIETEPDAMLIQVAKAHALWPMYAYREKKYLIP